MQIKLNFRRCPPGLGLMERFWELGNELILIGITFPKNNNKNENNNIYNNIYC